MIPYNPRPEPEPPWPPQYRRLFIPRRFVDILGSRFFRCEMNPRDQLLLIKTTHYLDLQSTPLTRQNLFHFPALAAEELGWKPGDPVALRLNPVLQQIVVTGNWLWMANKACSNLTNTFTTNIL